MKKFPFSGSASFVIRFEKVSQSTFSPRVARKSGIYPLLYIIYIFNGNNDAMTQSPVCRGFLRVIIRVIVNFPRKRRAHRVPSRVIMYAPLRAFRFSVVNPTRIAVGHQAPRTKNHAPGATHAMP